LKAAFSDALKRTAVKFGIGRYLYRLPQQWADYDPVKKQFAGTPRLPDWATEPKSPTSPTSAAKPDKSARAKECEVGTPNGVSGLPSDGKELHRRLRNADSELAAQGLSQIGDLLAHVTQAGVKAGFGADVSQWTRPAIELAAAETRAFKSRLAAAPEAKTAA